MKIVLSLNRKIDVLLSITSFGLGVVFILEIMIKDYYLNINLHLLQRFLVKHFLNTKARHLPQNLLIKQRGFFFGFENRSLSTWLVKHGLVHRSLGFDYQGVDTLQIKSKDWHSISPGGLLASVYHLTRIEYGGILEFRPFSGFGKARIFKNWNLMICGESHMIIIHA
ncbi:NAD(P)H-quinone oxidoreductase subunit J chloroplastic [Bienertia sinuspersici]